MIKYTIKEFIEKIYHGDIIEIIITEEGYGDSTVYSGAAGKSFLHLKTDALDNTHIVDIGNYVNDIGIAVMVIRLEEED